MSEWLWLASVYLMDAVGLDGLYELYHALVTHIERPGPRDESPMPGSPRAGGCSS